MREVNDNPLDPLGSLGKPIRPTPAAKPDPTPDAAGIVRHADGHLSTQIPEPAPIWTAPIYTPATAEDLAGWARSLSWYGD